ncbi:hypothetical protein Bca101_092456 [Brassica carinata]
MEDGGGDGSSGIGTGTVGGKHNKGKGVQNQTRLEADIRREQARKALQDGDPAEEFPFPQMYTIKARIVEKPKATPQDILTLLPTQGPIGISIDMDEKFSLLEDNSGLGRVGFNIEWYQECMEKSSI